MKRVLIWLMILCLILSLCAAAPAEETLPVEDSVLVGLWKLIGYASPANNVMIDVSYVTGEDEALFLEFRDDGTLALIVQAGGMIQTMMGPSQYVLDGNAITTDLNGRMTEYTFALTDGELYIMEEAIPFLMLVRVEDGPEM